MLTKANPLLQEALRYTEHGYPVLPVHTPNSNSGCSCSAGSACSSAGKHPRTLHGVKDATTDRKQIMRWWKKWPEANIGIATGHFSGNVLDVDPRNHGDATLRALIAGYGELPDTPTVQTGGGGQHFWFSANGATPQSPGQGIDVKSYGGFVVVPPSLHASGKRYLWGKGRTLAEMQMAELPDWVIQEGRKTAKSKQHRGYQSLRAVMTHGVPKGERNDQIWHWAKTLLQEGVPRGAVKRIAKQAARKANPPMSEHEAIRIVASAHRYVSNKTSVEAVLRDADANDEGNSRRFLTLFGDDVLYVSSIRSWYYWTGLYWQRDGGGPVREIAKRVAVEVKRIANEIEFNIVLDDKGREIPATAEDAVNKELKKNLEKIAFRLGNNHGAGSLTEMLAMASSNPGVFKDTPSEFDHKPHLLTLRNGTIDLKKGTLRAPRQTDFITKALPYEYNVAADCPKFSAFIKLITNGNMGVAAYLQRLLGGALFAGAGSRNQSWALFIGEGENGKTTLVELMKLMFGAYADTAPRSLVLRTQREEHPTAIADLEGKRLVFVSETGDGKRLNGEMVRNLTGGNKLKGRHMREDFREFDPTHTLIIETNFPPIIKESEYATWRRIHFVNFPVRISERVKTRKDYHKTLFREEASGILNWLIRGCLDWQKGGLNPPDDILAATDAYKADMTHVSRFIDECCDYGGYVPVDALYQAYVNWCREQNEIPVIGKDAFGKKVSELPNPIIGDVKTRHIGKESPFYDSKHLKQRCRMGISLKVTGGNGEVTGELRWYLSKSNLEVTR